MYRVGIDIGSTASKVAVLKDNEIFETFALPTGYSSIETAEQIYKQLENIGINKENAKFVATGYGRISVPYADKVVTEITCHGKGSHYLFGENGTTIDVGGQDTKAIRLKNGKVLDFIMNDKCSAGTGKFLEIMSNRMGVSQQQLTELAKKGKTIPISSMCTVFAESEVISLIGQGVPREDIANGIIHSVVNKVNSLVKQLENNQYFLTGGLCENEYFIQELSEILEKPVKSNKLARYAGAIGAALCIN